VLSKIHGCLAGLALGDALGMPTEFLTRKEISARFGLVERFEAAPPGHPHAGLPLGRVTDDTGQALAVARACQPDGRISAEKTAIQILAWADSIPAEEFAVIAGPSTRAALAELRAGGDARFSGRNGRTNGAAMRVAAAGLLYPGDLEGAAAAAVEAALPTHGTCIALSGAAAVACAVAAAVEEGATLDSVLAAAKRGAELGARQGRWVWSTPLSGRIELAEQIVQQEGEDAAALLSLYRYVGVDMLVPESVACAFGIVLLAGGDPMKAVRLGASIGGDTDTIAAIAGQVCGALQGFQALDEKMVRQVEQVNGLDLEEEARKLGDLLLRRKGQVSGG
jgi:ADP-ribosylglycohydrolase